MYLVASVCLWGACGGGDGDDSACEVAYTELCNLSCDCSAGDECGLATGPVTLSHDNRRDCVAFWATFGCSQPSDVDFDACSDALNAAQCTQVGEGEFLELPEACGEPPQVTTSAF